MKDRDHHHRHVEAWLARASAGGAASDRTGLLVAAIAAVWSRSRPPLGDVTLYAVARRALHAVSATRSIVRSVKVSASGFVLPSRLDSGDSATLEAGLAALLAELLNLLSAITGGVLEPALQAELDAVIGNAPPPKPAVKGRRRQ